MLDYLNNTFKQHLYVVIRLARRSIFYQFKLSVNIVCTLAFHSCA